MKTFPFLCFVVFFLRDESSDITEITARLFFINIRIINTVYFFSTNFIN